VPRKKNGQQPGFGARLSQPRKTAGYTQQELAQELGVSRRMIAPKEKRQALQILDASIEREQLRATKG